MTTTTKGTKPGLDTPENNLRLCADSGKQPDSPDVPYFPATNSDFLSAIFVGLDDPQRPFVLGFAGKPKDRKAWGGEAYRSDKTNSDNAALNWYFSLAVYDPAEDGYHRREKDCAAVYGVMLDDLGTKALPLERLDDCPPSYVIETSPGNFQAAYLFSEPLTDFEQIKALNQSMVDAGLCDPGAKSPTTRYGRMPFASNGKTEPVFQCKLVSWHPARRYTLEEIGERLALAPPTTRKNTPGRKAAAIDRNADDIYTPRAAENEVITALKKRGLYKQPLGSGKHDITCPWVHEHTDQHDHGSAYCEPSDLYPIGWFKCQHSHGEKYRTGALLEFLGVTFTAAKHKPTIKCEAGEIGRIADAGERELAATGRYYLSGIIAAFASPTSPSAVAFPTNDEECQKLLLATLLAAPGVVVFDNLTTDLIPFKSLCSALTEEFLTGRILGVSKTATVGTRALFLSSGNNVEAVRDMARRCITVTLDPQVETPATRQFKSDPLTVVRTARARYVSLALTVIRAWLAAGAPKTDCKPLASYGQWSNWVRQPLLWLGLPDPAARVFEQLAQDPDRETLGRLLHAWRAAFGTSPTPIREVVSTAAGYGGEELREVLMEVAEHRGEIHNTRLGRWITRHGGRIVDGLRFEKASGTTSVVRWHVKAVQSGMSGKSGQFSQPAESVIPEFSDDVVAESL